MGKYLLSEMTWPEVKERIEANCIAVLPVGSLEQHGKHLPLNVDYFLVEKVVHYVAESREDMVVLPTIVYARSAHHLMYTGTISLQLETFINVVNDILVSLAKHGFRKVAIINGHGGNRGALSSAISKFQEVDIKHPLIVLANYYSFGTDKVKEIRESGVGGMAHAGEYETSLSLYLQPDLVEMDKAVKRVPRSPIPEYIYADLLGDSPISMAVPYDCSSKTVWEYTFCESGVAGDPTVASKEKGEKIFNYVINDMHKFFDKLSEIK